MSDIQRRLSKLEPRRTSPDRLTAEQADRMNYWAYRSWAYDRDRGPPTRGAVERWGEIPADVFARMTERGTQPPPDTTCLTRTRSV